MTTAINTPPVPRLAVAWTLYRRINIPVNEWMLAVTCVISVVLIMLSGPGWWDEALLGIAGATLVLAVRVSNPYRVHHRVTWNDLIQLPLIGAMWTFIILAAQVGVAWFYSRHGLQGLLILGDAIGYVLAVGMTVFITSHIYNAFTAWVDDNELLP